MRLTTWNVNGVRNPFSYPPWNSARSFPAMFDILQTDIIVMQELKIQRKDLRDDMVLLDGWDAYFSLPKHKKGYSGVGMYTRNTACAPIRAEEGLLGFLPSTGAGGVLYRDLDAGECIGGYPSAAQLDDLGVDDPTALDAEGRCLILEFPAFVLLGVYCPANSNGQRDDFRHGFICALDCRVRNLLKLGKRVVLVGDLNVNRDEFDGASALDDRRKGNVSHEEYISTPNRRIFNQLLIGGEVVGPRDEGRETGVLLDTTRHFHPDRRGMYTHWEQKINARPGNFGSRIDFILTCGAIQDWLKSGDTQDGLLGSDHCPVYLDFQDEVTLEDKQLQLVDLMHPAGVFANGSRLMPWQLQNAPALSAKRMQEFDKRRSIVSMFAGARPKMTQPVNVAVKSSSGLHAETCANRDAEEMASLSTASGQSIDAHISGATSPSPIVEVAQTLKRTVQDTTSSTNVKRKPLTDASPRTMKRQKSDNTAQSRPKQSSQQNLLGFFRSASIQSTTVNTTTAAMEPIAHSEPATSRPSPPPPTLRPSDTALPPTSAAPTSATPTPIPKSPTSPGLDLPSTASSPTTNAEARLSVHHSWNSLFSKPTAPLCESHDEPCKTMQTKKKGSNQGRSFWMCARPLGPRGEKEKGTEWRCGTFIWASDWGGGRK